MLVEIKGLTVRYGRITAIDGIDLAIPEGRVVAILGANGAGKSSLLRSVLGVERAASGTILYDGQDITKWPPPRRVLNGLVLVPEGRRILISQTIHENLLLGAVNRRDATAIQQEISTIYERFPNLAARRNMAASCLSGGEQQMLAVGRAMLANPRLLMLDEPSLGLSPIIVHELFQLIRELNRNGITIMLVEQNTGESLRIADYGYVLERGRIVTSGTPADLLSDDRLTQAYLGQETAEADASPPAPQNQH